MRLIDADALLANTGDYVSSIWGDAITVADIDDAPSIDVEPVRHGHWTQMFVSSGRPSWQCSVCGRRARGERKNLPYCHCGAKMDE